MVLSSHWRGAYIPSGRENPIKIQLLGFDQVPLFNHGIEITIS
jgi:hypothetical protein